MKHILFLLSAIFLLYGSIAFCREHGRPGNSNNIPYALPEAKDFELSFTQVSVTEYNIPAGTGGYVLVRWPYAFIGCTIWGLMIWNVSDSSAPEMLSHTDGGGTEPDLLGGLGDFDLFHDTLLIGALGRSGWDGLNIVNVANPWNPFHVSSYAILGHNHQTIVDETFAYQAWYESNGAEILGPSGLVTFDLTDPTHPILADSVRIPVSKPIFMWKDAKYSYHFNKGGGGGIYIVDLRNPYSLEYVSNIPFSGTRHGVIHENYLYVLGSDGSIVFDVSDPMDPIEITSFGAVPGSYCVTFDHPYICSSTGAGFALVDISIPEETHIAGWQPLGQCWHAGVYSERRMVYASTYNDLVIYKFTDTGIEEVNNLPNQLEVNVFPNPFNDQITIEYNIHEMHLPKEKASLKIYDIKGKEISDISSALFHGNKPIIWYAENISSGIYLLRLREGERSVVRKIVLIR